MISLTAPHLPLQVPRLIYIKPQLHELRLGLCIAPSEASYQTVHCSERIKGIKSQIVWLILSVQSLTQTTFYWMQYERICRKVSILCVRFDNRKLLATCSDRPRGPGDAKPPLSVHFLIISCSFRQIILILITSIWTGTCRHLSYEHTEHQVAASDWIDCVHGTIPCHLKIDPPFPNVTMYSNGSSNDSVDAAPLTLSLG